MIIRAATDGDLGPIAVFQTECWREAYAGLVPQDYLDRVSVADREQRWRERLLSGDRQIALATAGHQIAGVVSWAMTVPPGDVPPLELKSLYVAAVHRGGGTASALAAHALRGRPAHLWVFDGNQRAQAFYAKLGFGPDGARMADPDTGLTELRWVRG